MYSLLVGLSEGFVPKDRMFEYTEPDLKAAYSVDVGGLMQLPALSMPEIQDKTRPKGARVGSLGDFRPEGNGYRFSFNPNPLIEPIPSEVIRDAASRLEIDMFGWGELNRTHWAAKRVDLYRFVAEYQAEMGGVGLRRRGYSSPIEFPVDKSREPDLVAVMMPFSEEFEAVYEAIRLAVADAGLRCFRADEVLDNDLVMRDVASLLWRCQMVVADLTGKNANVFYEAGLSHALPRDTVLLTQDAKDVPFDLAAVRYLKYEIGERGLDKLRGDLCGRLQALVSRGDSSVSGK